MKRNMEKAYEIVNAKITFVSLVDRAANKRTFLMTKCEDGKADFVSSGKILKADVDSHYVTGVVYEPMEEDSHGNFMTEDEITKAAYFFAKNGNKVDLQHSFEPLNDAAVVETWVTKADFDFCGEPIKKGTWLMTVEVTDEDVWEGITKGKITGFSMGGIGDFKEEDVKLDNVAKNTGKKGLLKQLANALGLSVVEKGTVSELYEEQSKGTLFWNAFEALRTCLVMYDHLSERTRYETDETKIRENLEDFSNIIISILSSDDPIAPELSLMAPEANTVPAGQMTVEKAGKTLSAKNLQVLSDIQRNIANLKDSLDVFLKECNPDEKDNKGHVVEKEDKEMTQQEVEQVVAATIEQLKTKEKEQEAKAAEDQEADATVPEKKPATEEEIKKMVEAAVAKAVGPKQSEEQIEDMIAKVVEATVSPVLRAKGLPSNLGNGEVKKNSRHYLEGVL